jgi:hypothetical protein
MGIGSVAGVFGDGADDNAVDDDGARGFGAGDDACGEPGAFGGLKRAMTTRRR